MTTTVVAELREGSHTVRAKSASSEETNLKVSLAVGRSGCSYESTVVASGGSQQARLEEQPLQHRQWVLITKKTQLGSHRDALHWSAERNNGRRVVLKVSTDTREVRNDGNAMVLQVLSWTNSTAHEQLRGSDRTTSNQDFSSILQDSLEFLWILSV